MTYGFKVEVGLHQGSVLSPILFAMVMERLTNDVRWESRWTMMFADDCVISSESRNRWKKTWREEELKSVAAKQNAHV